MTCTKIFFMTFNQHGGCYKQSLGCIDQAYEIIIIASQECCHSIQMSYCFNSKTKWRNAIKSKLQSLSNKYRLVSQTQVNAQMLSIYALDHIQFSCLRSLKIYLGKYGPNKGAILTQFCLKNQPIIIISCHLESGQDLSKRDKQINKILDTLRTNKICFHQSYTQEKIFVLGDLNYRINLDEQSCLDLVQSSQIQKLLQCDQILEKQNFMFSDIKNIQFSPTFKRNNNIFVAGRIPSYTDRILQNLENLQEDKSKRKFIKQSQNCSKSEQKSNFIPIQYDCLQIDQSDHYPVFGQVNLVQTDGNTIEECKVFSEIL